MTRFFLLDSPPLSHILLLVQLPRSVWLKSEEIERRRDRLELRSVYAFIFNCL